MTSAAFPLKNEPVVDIHNIKSQPVVGFLLQNGVGEGKGCYFVEEKQTLGINSNK